jgi:hypothetical protein
MPESLSDRYAELLSGSYDCADRIVLNAYFRMGHTAGGFRVWWGTLTGSEETLDNTHLMRMAGRFSRRVHSAQWEVTVEKPAYDLTILSCTAAN